MTVDKISPCILAFAACFLMISSCTVKKEVRDGGSLFPEGTLGGDSSFTGNVWHTPLVTNDSIYHTVSGNVRFEQGARTHWHTHPGGQILIVVEGVGYHQLKGEAVQTIRKGDVVKCPPGATHWHGATKDSGMSHLYILPNLEKGRVKWMEPVTDEEYEKEN